MNKIFKGDFDEEVHNDFLKFGRGEYKDRYLIECKRQSKVWSVKTGPEFVNLLVERCLKKVSGRILVSGIIVSTMDLKNEINFEISKSSNFQGIRKISVNTEVEVSEILRLMEKYPRVFFALSFKGDNFVLKVKAKAPKSAKPGKESEDGPKAEFCSLKTNDNELVRELFFDLGDFKDAKVNHTIFVESIVYPGNMNELKPTEIREQSKRKGKIVRKVSVDSSEKISEAEFVA